MAIDWNKDVYDYDDEDRAMVSVPRDKLDDIARNLNELTERLRTLEERRQLMFRSLLDAGAIKPGAAFEVVDTFYFQLKKKDDFLREDKKQIMAGTVMMFVGLTGEGKYQWLLNENVEEIDPDIICEYVILRTNGSNKENE